MWAEEMRWFRLNVRLRNEVNKEFLTVGFQWEGGGRIVMVEGFGR